MASQSTKSVIDSSTLVKTDMPEQKLTDDIVEQEDLYKVKTDKGIDFTIKTDLTDATFVVEGRKIYAGSDFLSLHSPYFRALLKGNDSAERKKDEIELKNVAYKEFYKMLLCLYDRYPNIEYEDVESLLTLGDRFGIKRLTDRVERYLSIHPNSWELEPISLTAKLLIADRFKLVDLQNTCMYLLDSEKRIIEAVNSEEFEQLSDSTKQIVIERNMEKLGNYNDILPREAYEVLRQVDSIDEPVGGFVATGVLGLLDEHERGEDYPIQYARIAGFDWCVEEVGGYFFSPFIVVNSNQLSSLEWSVEGFAEFTSTKRKHGSIGSENYKVVEKFAFSLDHMNRVGMLPQKTVEFWKAHNTYATIYITKTSGVSEYPQFDFSVPSDLSDVVLKVEGKELHVNKQYLSSISYIFRKMFKSDVDGEVLKVLELENVEYKDVFELLSYVYPSRWRNVTASSSFSILTAAEKLGIDIDKRSISNYIESLSPNAFYAEKIIFCFQFDIFSWKSDLERGSYHFRSPYHSDHGSTKKMELTYNKLNECHLFNKMTADEKLALYEWMVKKEYDSEDSSDDSEY